jgi:hypothetical protein
MDATEFCFTALALTKLPVWCHACSAGSDLASCLSRAIQQSYHIVQEQYLAEARELLSSHDRFAPPVVVGQPLPLDAAFYQRYQEGRAKVRRRCCSCLFCCVMAAAAAAAALCRLLKLVQLTGAAPRASTQLQWLAHMYHVTSSACSVQSRSGVPAAILLTSLRRMLWLQAWEVLDPPSGWDVSGPVLATGYYHVSATVLQLVMMMDDALAHACHQGEQRTQRRGPFTPNCHSLAGCAVGMLLSGALVLLTSFACCAAQKTDNVVSSIS